VEEMSNIKKLLGEYQDENSRLKIDNNEFYEQLEILRMNYDKMQIKYDENIEREETILNDLQSYINEVGVLKDRLAQAHTELDQAESAFVSIRKEVDEEKLQSRRVTEKYEASERNLERASLEMRDLKIRVSEYETNNEINGKMGERYRALERKKGELEEEYRKVKLDYDNIINVFVYKREDLEKAVSETRTQERRLKDE
jgi:chromosome segregation ATPase